MTEETPLPSTAPQQPSRLVKLAPVLLWAVVAFTFAQKFVYVPLTTHGVDFSKHWDAARSLLEGRGVYMDHEPYHGFTYPLMSAVLYLWLGAFSLESAEHVWELFHACLMGGVVVLLATYGRPSALDAGGDVMRDGIRRYWALACALLVVLYQPLQKVMLSSNIEPLNVLWCCVFTLALVRRRDGIAGVGLAGWILVKLAPVLVFPALLAARRLRVVAVCVAILVGYALLLAVTGYWRVEWPLYRDILPRAPHNWMSISRSMHRVILEIFYPLDVLDDMFYRQLVFKINAVLAVLYLSVMGAWWWRQHVVVRSSIVLVAASTYSLLLFSPLVEVIHGVWVVPIAIIALSEWASGRVPTRAIVPLMLGYFVLMNLDVILDLQRGSKAWQLPVRIDWIPQAVGVFVAGVGAWLAVLLDGRRVERGTAGTLEQ